MDPSAIFGVYPNSPKDTAAGLIAGPFPAMMGQQAENQQITAAQTANYNAALLTQQGTQAAQAADVNSGISTRKSAVELGEQAAAEGEANVGTGNSVQGIEKQSATSARIDALNVWYGGQLEKSNANNMATLQKYNQNIDVGNEPYAYGQGVLQGTQQSLSIASSIYTAGSM